MLSQASKASRSTDLAGANCTLVLARADPYNEKPTTSMPALLAFKNSRRVNAFMSVPIL
jgi:hypothetical protein